MTERTLNTLFVIGILSVASLLVTGVLAQETTKTLTPPEGSVASAAPLKPAIPSRAELEKQFEQELTGATLTGVWQMTGEGGLSGKSDLTPPKPDLYVISKVAKVKDDYWLITAQIKYADKDVNIPVPVRVVWAEDTAIITLNDLTMPLLGTYSARVMIHHGFYSGVWYCGGKNYGGVMQGRITKTSDNAHPEAKRATE